MRTPLIEAFELIASSHELESRLRAAADELAKRPGLKEEKTWLAAGRVRLGRAREGIGDLLDRALRLPELESRRGDRARLLQNEVVDALERVSAKIALAVSPRSPLIEALFANVKTPLLRRVDPDELEAAWADFEKRLASSYVKRMLADPEYAAIVPPIDEVRAALQKWRDSFDPPPLDEATAQALCEELVTLAHRIELPSRQARLLAQAALLSMKDILDEHGLTPKPKRRGAIDPDTHPLLEQDPPDPNEPTPEERAELEEVGATSRTSSAKAAKPRDRG